MSLQRVAALLMGFYCLLLCGNALLYYSWSQDSSEVPHLLFRVGGMALVAVALWRDARGAWWLALAVCGILGLLGLWSTYVVILSGVLEHRPYPLVDKLFLGMASTTLVTAGVLLVLHRVKSLKTT